MTDPMPGGCLCGAARFTARPKAMHMGVCHCHMCQRWNGGVAMAVECEGEVTFEDESALGVYVSSDWGERGFCKSCGTSLFWRMRDRSMYSIAAPAFDDMSQFAFTTEIFIDEKPAAYSFANDTKKMTGEEIFALFAPKET